MQVADGNSIVILMPAQHLPTEVRQYPPPKWASNLDKSGIGHLFFLFQYDLEICPLIEAFKCQRGDIKITIIDHRILFLDNDGISTFGSNIGNNLHKFLLERSCTSLNERSKLLFWA